MILNYPPVIIPGGYMAALGNRTSSLTFRLGGLATATATIPTWLMGLAVTTSNAFSATTPLAATATFTPPGAVTNAPFWLEADILIRSQALTNTSTVVTLGKVTGPGLLPASSQTSNGMTTLPATNVAATMTTWEVPVQYWLWPYLTLGAATAGNTVTVQYVKLFGEN